MARLSSTAREAVTRRTVDEDEEDLSPQQIDQLLEEAEGRLRAKNTPQELIPVDTENDTMHLTPEIGNNTALRFK